MLRDCLSCLCPNKDGDDEEEDGRQEEGTQPSARPALENQPQQNQTTEGHASESQPLLADADELAGLRSQIKRIRADLLERGESIDSLYDRSDSLSTTSKIFHKQSKQPGWFDGWRFTKASVVPKDDIQRPVRGVRAATTADEED